jgi:hypothetical protein
MWEFLWMNEYPHKHPGCKASSFGIGNQLINQSINQVLRYPSRAKGLWDYNNGKRDLTRRWRYQWKYWVHPGQRGFGGTGLGPDTTKHNLTSMCTTTSLQQRGHLGPQQTLLGNDRTIQCLLWLGSTKDFIQNPPRTPTPLKRHFRKLCSTTWNRPLCCNLAHFARYSSALGQ